MTEGFDIDSLPCNREAEQSVLGAMMLDPLALDRAGSLERRHFFDPAHGTIFEVAADLLLTNRPADMVTLAEALGPKLAEVGGLSYLHALQVSVPSSARVRHYADIVRSKATERALIETADEALGVASSKIPIEDRIQKIIDSFLAIQRRGMRTEPRQLGQLIAQRVEYIEGMASGEVVPRMPTHIPELNRLLNGGFQGGYLYVLAARPSVGKSSFSQELGEELAMRGHTTLALSMEMSDGDVTDRAIAKLGRLSYSRIQTGQLQEDEWGKLAEAMDRGAKLPFYVDAQPALTLAEINAKARQIPGLRVLIVDYLQLAKGGRPGENRNNQIEEISRGLKALAKILDIAVIELSQLNRAVEQRADKRPNLADLRDSGAIEQDADVVIFLWPAREIEVGGLKIVGCAVDKNRQGLLGSFCLGYSGETQQWRESELSVEMPGIPPVPNRGLL